MTDAHAANNPLPLAQAVQMPLGPLQDEPWVNRVLNAYRKPKEVVHANTA